MLDPMRHTLQERVKELTALHGAARLLQDAQRPHDTVMAEVVALLPLAWQYPEAAAACITLGSECWATPGFAVTSWRQLEEFRLRDGSVGTLDVVYLAAYPEADEGPFLREERELIRSLAEMLRAFWQHRQDDARIMAANEQLEIQVAERTAALRRLASEQCLVEARERRAIAEDLHDHLGQALAFSRARLRQLQGDVVFGGHGAALEELLELLDQAIGYTRDLTFELSPPVLYELGLGPALDWLAENFARKQRLKIEFRDRCRRHLPDDLRVLFFKSARELLHNVAKHAQAHRVKVELSCREESIILDVEDDGCGFVLAAAADLPQDRSFGLFSIEERLRQLGGSLEIRTARGAGTRVRLVAALPPEVPH
jgi:signal transduction histidine kinase